MSQDVTRVLVLGYGNPGRLDDGLGPALVTCFESRDLGSVTWDAKYQLEPEDAELVSQHDIVIFVDATVDGPEPFALGPVTSAGPVLSFTSHNLGPPEIMGLAVELFGSHARAYLLGIRGYEFDEFGERLSAGAYHNLKAAEGFLEQMLRADHLRELIGSPVHVASTPDRLSS